METENSRIFRIGTDLYSAFQSDDTEALRCCLYHTADARNVVTTLPILYMHCPYRYTASARERVELVLKTNGCL